MNPHEEEIAQVLSANTNEFSFETIAQEESSPLNQPVKEKDIGGNTYNSETVGFAPFGEEESFEKPKDAPEQVIDSNYDNTQPPKEVVEVPTEQAEMMAEMLFGTADNLLAVGGGWFIKMRKDEAFYEFDEIVQFIKTQNETNVQRLLLDEHDKLLLRPLIVAIIKKRGACMTPEQQLLMATLSILMKKINIALEIKAENELMLARILEEIKSEKASTDTNDTEEEPQQNTMTTEAMEETERGNDFPFPDEELEEILVPSPSLEGK